MNIAIVTTGHSPFDERIFYKFAVSLQIAGYNVSVISSGQETNTESEGIKVRGFDGTSLSKKDKVEKLLSEIAASNPALVICCEPLAITAAYRYKKQSNNPVKIIYDITEYYPHQNTLNLYEGFSRKVQYAKLSLFNAYVSNLADYLFIGEEGKVKLYDTTAPFRKKAIIGYYAPKRYFHYYPPAYDGRNFTLCYAGRNAESGGFRRYTSLLKTAAQRFPGIIFTAKVIGMEPEDGGDMGLESLSNVKTIYTGRTDYINYPSKFEGTDICIDLRDKNIIHSRSLPIKVFDYIACGKPFIFSNLDSFKGYDDLRTAGLMTDPDDIESSIIRISGYLNNPEKLKEDSLTAYKLFEEKYNWEIVEKKMLRIIDSLFTNR